MKLLKDIDITKRKAVFRSVFAYKEKGSDPVFFLGECYGRIADRELGDHGFGFDPVFIPVDDRKTFAQMEVDEKNRFSHRGKSLEKLMDFLKKDE